MEYEKLLTEGEFTCEADAWEKFDSLIELFPDVFRPYKEVWGYPVQPRLGTEMKKLRIDRVLVPRQKLIDAGWPHGPIGIECKTSGKKVGPVLAQAADYSRSVFELPHGFRVMLEWIFIWPLESCAGELASVMAQNRIGCVQTSHRDPLRFFCAGTNAITVDNSGNVKARRMLMGNASGSR